MNKNKTTTKNGTGMVGDESVAVLQSLSVLREI
jgi:hypothetical protein